MASDPLKVQVQQLAIPKKIPSQPGRTTNDCRIFSALAFDIDAPNWLCHVVAMFPHGAIPLVLFRSPVFFLFHCHVGGKMHAHLKSKNPLKFGDNNDL